MIEATPLIRAEVRAAPESPELQEGDLPWLEDITDIDITPEWLEQANKLIARGSQNLNIDSSSTNAVAEAREQFLGELVGWGKPEHGLHKPYTQFQNENRLLMPLSTFIGTQRTLHEYGLINSKIILANHSVLRKSSRSIHSTVKTLANIGHDAVDLINRRPGLLSHSRETLKRNTARLGPDCLRIAANNPSVLILSDKKLSTLRLGGNRDNLETKADRREHPKHIKVTKAEKLRLGAAQRIAQTLGWQGDITKLGGENSKLLSVSDAKLRVHARLFARFGSSEMSETEVAALIALPLKAHLANIIQERPYTAEAISETNKELALATANSSIERALADHTKSATLVGTKALRAYERYQSPLTR